MFDSEFISLLIPAWIAGFLTFFAPCTLPLVPGYLGFISGTSIQKEKAGVEQKSIRKKIVYNALLYVIGFSFVFILLGTAFGVFGALLGQYRIWLSRVGGIFVIFFGVYLLGIFHLPILQFLQAEKKFNVVHTLKPGKPSSSLLFGMTFAFGWTPCVGPILGSILLLASTSGTIIEGGVLLGMFSLGLAVPFLLVALAIGHATQVIAHLQKYIVIISNIGGLFLIVIGVLLVADKLGIWVSYFYDIFGFIHYDSLLDYL